MRTLLIAALLPLCGAYVTTSWKDLEANPQYSFDDYLQEFKKSYSGAEYETRKGIFLKNLQMIRSHNSDKTQSWKMGLNQFTDLTDKEMKQRRRGVVRSGPLFGGKAQQAEFQPVKLPESVDWREKNVVTEVKNQGGCGSCWAFSATESLESAAAIASGQLKVLAPQQYVSCSPNPDHCGGAGGCSGSTQPLAFNYSQTHGLVLEKDYPYTQRTGQCDVSRTRNPAVGHKSYVELPTNNYTALITAVATQGPVAISVAADWGRYESGVFNNAHCGYDMDHGVLLVGYGHDASSGLDYWLVRNSWGRGWGEHGYIKVARFGEGKEPCGMDNTPQNGDACKGDRTPRQYCGLCAILSSSSYPTGAFVH